MKRGSELWATLYTALLKEFCQEKEATERNVTRSNFTKISGDWITWEGKEEVAVSWASRAKGRF